MRRRQITLEDGRYLIFYTFDEETGAASPNSNEATRAGESAAAPLAEPEAKPQATEEPRRV